MTKDRVEGNIVEVYKIGNTTVQISDAAYRDKTPEDIEKILQRINEIGWKIVQAARAAGKDI